MQLACIVEGHGEVQAAPVLLRRLASALDPTVALRVEPVIRITKSKLIQTGELERAVELAARKIGGEGAILILLDSDEDCPAELGPRLLARARRVRARCPDLRCAGQARVRGVVPGGCRVAATAAGIAE